MKQLACHIILFAYVLMLFKPIAPYIADGMAHALWYADHIKTVHHQHGGNHVHYEITEQNKKGSNDSPSSLKKDADEKEYIVFNEHHLFLTIKVGERSSQPAVDPEAVFPGCHFPPPKV